MAGRLYPQPTGAINSAPQSTEVSTMTFTYDAARDCLTDKTILITGASDGIGRVVAAEFCARGANVIALGRSQEKLEALFDEIEATSPGR